MFAFAGVWKDSEVASFAVLTCEPNAALRHAGRDAMPVILPPDPGAWQLWLHASSTSATLDEPVHLLAGHRYLHSPGNGWRFQLFVRSKKGAPYQACGPVTLERAEGSKPMTIYWRLERPLPVRLYQEFSVLRDA